MPNRTISTKFKGLRFDLCLELSLNYQRYLTPFDPKVLPHRFADVLIIGGGLAGMRAALAVDNRLRVVLITKDDLTESNSNYAQGGIAGVLDPEDRFEWHIQDTLEAGGKLWA